VLEVARALSDDLDALSSEEDVKTASDLLCAFVRKIDFGKDMERTLQVLSSARASLSRTDAVKQCVVECTLSLADRALEIVRGRHTAKTSAFTRAVLTSAAVGIPAVDDPILRLELYTRAGSCALRNVSVTHADMLFRAAVQELPELPSARSLAAAISSSTPVRVSPDAMLELDAIVVARAEALMQAVVLMPGHPEHGPLYLVKGLLTAASRYPWSPSPAHSVLRSRS